MCWEVKERKQMLILFNSFQKAKAFINYPPDLTEMIVKILIAIAAAIDESLMFMILLILSVALRFYKL